MVDPGDFDLKSFAEIDRGLMERLLCGCGPEFELVTVAAALVAVVTAPCYVYGEYSAVPERPVKERRN